jgi:hypothetical protein
VAAAVFSPWWLRNLLWTGNPVYPLMSSFFNMLHSTGGVPTATGVTDLLSKDLGHFTYRAIIYKESGWEIALIPLRIFFQGVDNMPRYFDGVLHPFLLVLPAIALIRTGRSALAWRRDAGYMSLFAVLTVLIVFFQASMRIRYVSPMIPSLVVLSVGGLRSLMIDLADRYPAISWRKVILPIVVAGLMVPNAIYAKQLFADTDPIAYLTGKTSRQAYIIARRPEFAIFDYANRNLGKDAHLLSLFLSRRHYYCEIPITEANGYFLGVVRQASSGREIAAVLGEEGYTHIVLNGPLVNRWLADNLSRSQKAMAKDFFSRWTSVVFRNENYSLLALRPFERRETEDAG